ncbi:MAG: hypothetical protein RBT73_06525 [Spirochaetia bacterium]|jgi:hypothetical protein|nr:hypothetical protein [Spirochaetia bacterium]
MPRSALKGFAVFVAVILLTVSFSGCDQIMDLLGLGDDETELNENQVLLKKLFSELKKGDEENGFTITDSENVRTRTFANYTNANGVILNGTDEITFNGTPPPTSGPPPPPPVSEQIAGNMAMGFSGSITGGPYNLTLKMTRTPPQPPTYTECKVNTIDMLADYQSMPKD